MKYLTEHGTKTIKLMIKGLKDIFWKHSCPMKTTIIGIGGLSFTSRDEMYGAIKILEKLLKADGGKKNG